MDRAGVGNGVALNADCSKHILFINEFYWPDVCASSAVLTDHLSKLAARRPDWRISVLAGDRAWDRPDVRWPQREQHGRVDVHRVPRGAVRRTMMGRAWGFARFHRAAIRFGRRLDRPDVIVASTAPPLGGRIGAGLARHHGCRLVYKVLDLYPDCAAALGLITDNGLMHRIWRRIDTRAMIGADAVAAISSSMAERIASTRNLPTDRVHCIADGFDPARLQTDGSFRREQGMGDCFVVQYAGNMGLSHPFETILAAVRALADDRRIAFQFIGAGPGRDRIRAAIRDQRLAVQLLDYQPSERLGDVLATADIALITQDAALAALSLPYKVYGILAAGRPGIFIGSGASEIAQWYRQRDCGLHVEQGDVGGLVQAICTLADDRSRAAAMGRRARALFDERFHSDNAVQRWEELLDRVLTSA